MTRPAHLPCVDAGLAVECARAASQLGVPVEPGVVDAPVDAAIARLRQGERAGPVTLEPPPLADVLRLADAAREGGTTAFLCTLGEPDGTSIDGYLTFAGDAGVVAVDEVRPLLACLAAEALPEPVWAASPRALPLADQARLAGVLRPGPAGGGRLVPLDDGVVGWSDAGDATVALGEARDLVHALAALRARWPEPPTPHAAIPDLDRDAVREVLFGPRRSLSDPTSKAALASYGLPQPAEELCSSPSRAAAEAGRIGFPVRMALASPDLRVWDHPDLEVDGVESAARARETYRQLLTLARARRGDARLLGVTVSASRSTRAALRFRAWPAPGDRVLATIGFADPHGLASGDESTWILPATPAYVERGLSRLAGASLLLEGSPAQRADAVGHVADLAYRIAAFVNDHRREVLEVELRPVVWLVGGGLEVREARVQVGDAFERAVDAGVPGPDGAPARG